MIDRAKIIKALSIHADSSFETDCKGCLYNEDVIAGGMCISQLCADALALLKEQEPVKPTLVREGRNKYFNNYVCPGCDNDLTYEQNYCSECGRALIWE